MLFIVQDIDTEKYGYVTTRGTEKLKLKYDTLALISNSKIYEQSIDIKNNKITASENGKYGVIDLSNGNTIIDFKYDNIYLGPNNYYVVKQNESYYLIDKDGNKIIDKGYEMIFAFDKVLVVCENDEIKILDYDGKRLIDTKIQTFINYKEQPIDDIFGYMATKNSSNDIIIEVNKSNSDNSKINRYIYHIDTKKLEVK